MTNNKNGENKNDSQDTAPRARNRTVMLTPDMTTQVRARLSKKVSLDEPPAAQSFFSSDENASSDSISLPYEEFKAAEQQISYQSPEEESSLYQELDNQDNYASDSYSESEDQGFETINPISRQVHKIEAQIQTETDYLPADIAHEDTPAEAEPYVETAKKVVLQPAFANVQSSRPTELSIQSKKIKNEVNLQDSQMGKNYEVYWSKITPIVGFFVSYDEDPNGEVIVLRSGRLLVSSEKPTSGSYVYIEDETVSPMHAILRITEDGQVQLLDNLSEYGTVVIRADSSEEINLSGEKSMLYHGDIVKFGSKSFALCLIKSV